MTAIPTLRATGDPAVWLAGHGRTVLRGVRRHGATILRGLGVTTGRRLAEVRDLLGATRAVCQEPFASRSLVADGVHEAADWPGSREMCPHHEQAHALDYPGLLLFACVRPAESGGAMVLSDTRQVLAGLPAELVADFTRHGWLLRRAYHPGLGLSWPAVFGTADPVTVARYCDSRAIDTRWVDGGTLRTTQRRPAVVRHPSTGEACWFNQVAFFSQWGVPAAEREVLLAVYGTDGMPFTTARGDGCPLAEDEYATVISAYERSSVPVSLEAGDVVAVDNILMATGREPYAGARDLVVALCDPVFPPPIDDRWP